MISVSYLFCIFGIFISSSALAVDWSDYARKFTGESDSVKSQAIAELRKIPFLEGTLREELKGKGKNKLLALDVVSTLKLTSLLPDLIQYSEFDESGYFYHAINAFITPANKQNMIRLYRSRLHSHHSSSAAKLVLLDTLGRMQSPLTVDELEKLLHYPDFEIRQSALYYIRFFLLKLNYSDYLQLLKIPLLNSPFQIKIQTLYLISELPYPLKRRTRSILKTCADDSSPEVKQHCLKLSGEIQ